MHAIIRSALVLYARYARYMLQLSLCKLYMYIAVCHDCIHALYHVLATYHHMLHNSRSLLLATTLVACVYCC